MTVKKFFLILKKSLLFFLYVALFFYTITFSTPVSWMVFYFFTVVFLVSFLSTFILWGKAQFEILKGQDNLLNGHLNLKTKSFFPVLIPYLMVSISVKEKTFSTVVPSLFKQKLMVFFSDIRFPRGHHKKIFVRTSGKDVFGFFAHRSKKETPVDLEIYPNLLSSNVLYETLKKMDAKLELKQFSAHEAANFRQIREHQMQDALKDIDWKASFKKQALMVKEYDKETDTALKIYFLGYQSPHFEELLSLTYSSI